MESPYFQFPNGFWYPSRSQKPIRSPQFLEFLTSSKPKKIVMVGLYCNWIFGRTQNQTQVGPPMVKFATVICEAKFTTQFFKLLKIYRELGMGFLLSLLGAGIV